jgi:hypothetical protein
MHRTPVYLECSADTLPRFPMMYWRLSWPFDLEAQSHGSTPGPHCIRQTVPVPSKQRRKLTRKKIDRAKTKYHRYLKENLTVLLRLRDAAQACHSRSASSSLSTTTTSVCRTLRLHCLEKRYLSTTCLIIARIFLSPMLSKLFAHLEIARFSQT